MQMHNLIAMMQFLIIKIFQKCSFFFHNKKKTPTTQ